MIAPATAAHLATGIASLLLVTAGAWLALGDAPVAALGRPTIQAGAVAVLVARPVPIDRFAAFNVNDQNPFIPADQRAVEQQALVPVPPIIPPAEPGHQQPQPPASRTLPLLPSAGASCPTATGLLIAKDRAQALLTFPGATHATLMRPGDTVNGWTLVEVSDGNVVRMRDAVSGTVHALVVRERL